MNERLTCLVSPFRIILQKLFKRLELLQHALDRVQLIAPDNDLFALVLFTHDVQLGLHARMQTVLPDPVDVDANRMDADRHQVAIRFEPGRRVLVSQDARAVRQEMPRVVVCLERHQIRAKHAQQDILAA